MNKGIKLKNNVTHEREMVSSSGLLQHHLRLGASRHEGPCTPNSEAWNFCYSDGESLSGFASGRNMVKSACEKTPLEAVSKMS